MSAIIVDKTLCNGCKACIAACPFNAIEPSGNYVEITAQCKACKLCIKACEQKALSLAQAESKVNKAEWKGILVYVEHYDGKIHPVTFELIGKALELSKKNNEPVCCVFIGDGVEAEAERLFDYGASDVYVYDYPQLKHFCVGTYANAMTDCINKLKPNVVLIGATPVGRSLAPRVATRFKTGLTADCTYLEMRDNGDLVQIRPAFGGNIMAQILTKSHRPQFATVRYKVMEAAKSSSSNDPSHKIIKCSLPQEQLSSRINILDVSQKVLKKSIVDADVLVVAGRGVRTKEDLHMLQRLADSLGGLLACTRPLAEQGWLENVYQIGLSGRTVKPKLIITCGVSGAIQFVAGMQNAETIISINTDKNAPIFKLSHYGFVGDIYEIIPKVLSEVENATI